MVMKAGAFDSPFPSGYRPQAPLPPPVGWVKSSPSNLPLEIEEKRGPLFLSFFRLVFFIGVKCTFARFFVFCLEVFFSSLTCSCESEVPRGVKSLEN